MNPELAHTAIGMIDLTDLADDQSADGIDELCGRAARHGTAAVCVWPVHVARCAELLGSSTIRVATVVNFPSGDEALADVVDQTQGALRDGADEIDVVLPYRALIAGDELAVGRTVAAVAAALEPTNGLKVILETGALATPELIRSAASIAIDNGADFIKTSTGKIDVGASPDAVRAMLEVIVDARRAGRAVGIKPSGGVRTAADVEVYLGLAEEIMGVGWATPATFRFGASGLLDVLLEAIDPTAPRLRRGF